MDCVCAGTFQQAAGEMRRANRFSGLRIREPKVAVNDSRSGKLKRLSEMSWHEIFTRSRQGINKRRDLVQYGLGLGFTPASLGNAGHDSTRFFFRSEDLPQRVSLLRDKLPLEANRILEEARQILQHRFDLLGYQGLDYGPKIDWHLDAVHGKRAPRKPWFKIRNNFEEIGDPKVIWELNRHQHLVTLAKAFRLSEDARFLDELLHQWRSWNDQNPYPIGINWASALEMAFRSISWLWVRHLVAGRPEAPDSFQAELVCALALNGRNIELYLSTYHSPNTHLLGEGVGLYFIGTLCPQIAAAERWKQLGWAIVLREAERQIQADGMHFEQSLYYHVYALDFFLHARILAACNQISIPGALDVKLEKMLEILLRLGQSGSPPRFGDDDGGRLFNPRRNCAEHMLDPLATGAVIFKRPDFKAAAGSIREETLWLMGPEGLAQFDALPQLPPSFKSVRQEASGVCVMTSPNPIPLRLVVDAGPQGAGSAGHGHADALSLHLTVDGREWLTDPGTFCYVSAGNDRNLFRGTAFHNTLQVDSLDQAEPAGPFGWRSLPAVQVEKWIVGETFDLFVGSHTGYSRLPDPVIHRRWVFNLKSQYFLVCDLALGKGEHQLDLSWHFAPGAHSVNSPTGAESHWALRDVTLTLLPVESHGWSREIIQGRVSPVYGKEEPAPVLRFSSKVVLPADFSVLVRPGRGEFEGLGVLTRMHGEARVEAVRGYRYDYHKECHLIFIAEPGKRWSLSHWASDAEFLYYCGGPGEQSYWVLCGGSYVEVDGQRVVTCKRVVERLELSFNQGEKRLSCSDESAVDYFSEKAITGVF
ncbi:MAG TPA: alginate lyase family protein [Terriglobia bacterium]|nr:alginate lyase family protein [Terriglobia bacterium]